MLSTKIKKTRIPCLIHDHMRRSYVRHCKSTKSTSTPNSITTQKPTMRIAVEGCVSLQPAVQQLADRPSRAMALSTLSTPQSPRLVRSMVGKMASNSSSLVVISRYTSPSILLPPNRLQRTRKKRPGLTALGSPQQQRSYHNVRTREIPCHRRLP